MKKTPPWHWLLTIAGTSFVAVWMFPLYWMAVSSLKTQGELFRSPPTLWPVSATFEAYTYIFARDNVLLFLGNSFLIAGLTTICALALGTGAAWGLARIKSRWVEWALVAILLAQVLPPALMATPMFVLFRQVGLIDTYAAMVIACMTKAVPFVIVMLRPALLQIPVELEEAAQVDGCSRLGAFARIVLPLLKPALVVSASLAFLLAYGEFVYASAFLIDKTMHPATIGLYSFVGSENADWNYIMAFATIFVLPVMVLFLFLQRAIVRGLTAGALK